MFIFFYKLGQTLGSLTSVKPNMQSLLVLLASCLAESTIIFEVNSLIYLFHNFNKWLVHYKLRKQMCTSSVFIEVHVLSLVKVKFCKLSESL